MSELKPCPWCPAEPRIRHNRNGIGSEAASRNLPELWEVSCTHIERHGRAYGKTRDEAIDAWNRRTPQPVTPAGGEDYRIGMFDRWDAYAKELGYTGMCDALANLAILRSKPPVADAALVQRLIEQLPSDHDGRNTWLLNYGVGDEADWLRAEHKRYRQAWADHREGYPQPTRRRYQDAALNQRGGWCMSHTCHANACGSACRPEHLMCPKHWGMVPEATKAAVLRHYRPGQCDDMRPSREWLDVAKRAVLLVAIAEGAPMSKSQREEAAWLAAIAAAPKLGGEE